MIILNIGTYKIEVEEMPPFGHFHYVIYRFADHIIDEGSANNLNECLQMAIDGALSYSSDSDFLVKKWLETLPADVFMLHLSNGQKVKIDLDCLTDLDRSNAFVKGVHSVDTGAKIINCRGTAFFVGQLLDNIITLGELCADLVCIDAVVMSSGAPFFPVNTFPNDDTAQDMIDNMIRLAHVPN